MSRSRPYLRFSQLFWLLLVLPCLMVLETPKQIGRLAWLDGIHLNSALGQANFLHQQLQQQALEPNQRLNEPHAALFYQWQWLLQLPHFIEKTALTSLFLAVFLAVFVIRAPPFSSLYSRL